MMKTKDIRRATRYPSFERDDLRASVSAADEQLFKRALDISMEHSSGGSYDMVAILSNPKPLAVGLNSLSGSARHFHDAYPQVCGIHAELDLWNSYTNRNKMSGSTVAVAGHINSSGNPMRNTLPCIYCASLMEQAGVRWVIASLSNELIKVRCSRLTLQTS